MTDKNTGGPAFPLQSIGPEFDPGHSGMSLRDWFAGLAMQGLLANPGGPIQANGMNGWNWCNCTVENVADFAWHIADAMLKAREEA